MHLKLGFVGANPNPTLEPFGQLHTEVSYFIGNDAAKWSVSVPVWSGVRYRDLYPGIDLEITSENGHMVRRLVVKPGTDLSTVRMKVEGAKDVLMEGETLLLETTLGEYRLPLFEVEGRFREPLVYTIGGNAFEVENPFALPTTISQSLISNYQSSTSDLLYSTFLGGSDFDWGEGIAVDETGNTYITGRTLSIDFPTTPGAFDETYNGDYDGFVVKVNPNDSGLVYATFLGGNDNGDMGHDIALDDAGNAYITGETWSSDFPITPGVFDETFNGGIYDAFVVKLNPSGSGLVYASFLGGSGYDVGANIVVDVEGSAYITGGTTSGDFPITPEAFDGTFNNTDAFVVKVNLNGSELAYSTFLGGSSSEGGEGIAVDDVGNVYVTGHTSSSDFPVTPGAFDETLNGSSDVFVVKVNPIGSDLDYATFLGGSSSQVSFDIAVDGAGSAYITGWTDSSDFPTTPGAFDSGRDGYSDAFVTKMNPTGSSLAYSSFLGGSGSEQGIGIGLDGMGSAYITGWTDSSDFPVTPGAFDEIFNDGSDDAFVIKVNPNGSSLTYATFLGGSVDADGGHSIAVDGLGNAYMTGRTNSSDFPITLGAFDSTFNGFADGFVVKMSMESDRFSIFGQISDNLNQPIAGVTISGSASSTTSDESGIYTITGLITGTYTLIPSKPGYSFIPPSRTVSVPPNTPGVDFIGMSPTQFPILLIPGIMGSKLSNDPIDTPSCWFRQAGEIWPNLDDLVYTFVYDLRLKTLWLDEDGINPANSCDQIFPTGIIDQLPAISDFYATFISAMGQVYVFDYDWRLDINTVADQLDQFVNTTLNQTGASKVVIVGHSMGGLVARYYTSDPIRAQKVDKVISVGTPYWGAPKLARHMREGSLPIEALTLLTYNSTVRELIRNSPGAMQLLPSDAYFQQSGRYFMVDEDFKNTWQETRDFFVQENQNGTLIDGNLTLHQNIDDFRTNLSVPYYVLTANHLPTPLYVREFPCWYGGTCWDWYSYISGDETVPWISARLSGIVGDWSGNAEVCTYSSGKGHSELLSNLSIIVDVKSILNGGEPTNCVLSSLYQKKPNLFGLPEPFIQVALRGDSRIEVQDEAGNITGVTNEGYLINDIPNSTFDASEFGAFVTLPTDAVITVTIYQKSDVPIQFMVTDWQASSYEDFFNPMQRAVFVDVPSALGGVATMLLDLSAGYDNLLLSVDLNNDGTPDQTLEPTSVLDPEQIADISRPVTTIAVQGEQDGDFFTGPVTITLTASDLGTGVLKTEYSLDGGTTWQLYADPVQTVAENVPVFYVRSTDTAGNQEYPWPSQRLIPIQLFIPIVHR